MPTLTALAPMVATGPLTTPDGELLWQQQAPAPEPEPRRTITVRCLDRYGNDLADPVNLTGPIGRDALAQIVGDHADGAMDADRFARRAFRAMCDWQDATGRDAFLYRRLHALDRLAMTAVKADVPATVTWTTNPNGA